MGFSFDTARLPEILIGVIITGVVLLSIMVVGCYLMVNWCRKYACFLYPLAYDIYTLYVLLSLLQLSVLFFATRIIDDAIIKPANNATAITSSSVFKQPVVDRETTLTPLDPTPTHQPKLEPTPTTPTDKTDPLKNRITNSPIRSLTSPAILIRRDPWGMLLDHLPYCRYFNKTQSRLFSISSLFFRYCSVLDQAFQSPIRPSTQRLGVGPPSAGPFTVKTQRTKGINRCTICGFFQFK